MLNNPLVDTYSRKLSVYSYMTFGEWLRKNIGSAGLSNAELARRVGVSPTYIGNLVRDFSPSKRNAGVSRPSEQVVEKIATALDQPVDEARLAAGYAPANGSSTDLDVGADIRVSLLHAKEYSEEDLAEFEIGLGAAFEVLKSRIVERRNRVKTESKV